MSSLKYTKGCHVVDKQITSNWGQLGESNEDCNCGAAANNPGGLFGISTSY